MGLRAKLVCVLLSVVAIAHGQIPNGYYNQAQGLSGTQLKTALHNIITSGHSALQWTDTWTALQSTDVKSNGKVWDVYSWVPSGPQPYEYTFGPGDQCGNYSAEGDCYNREHVWPQSLFNSALPMRSDLHSLFASDGWVNNARADFPFGEVSNVSSTYQQGSTLGSSTTYPSYSGMTFEPIDSLKGDFARAILYFATRYEGQDAGWSDWPMANGADLTNNAIAILRTWHTFDPVSTKEINRNNAVFTLQGNRNPFVDFPEFVECIWGTSTACSGLSVRDVNATALTLQYANNKILLPNSYNGKTYTVFNTYGQVVTQAAYMESINTSSLTPGVYLLRIENMFAKFSAK
ncbi:MAG: Extracellular ribonuclease precursor [Bacteroidota bacterium]|jgi:endonuclease I